MSVLTAKGLSFRSPEGAQVFDRIDFTLAEGEMVDIVGASGSGKTTFLRALARLLPGASGELELVGTPADEMPPSEWRARVALLPQTPAIVPGNVRDNLLMPWRLKVRTHAPVPGDAALEEALASVGMADIALDRDAARLSVGESARVALLRVVLTQPAVILLDEPDAALDPESALRVGALTADVVKRGASVVRICHRNVCSCANRSLRLAGGHLTEVGA